ncbi:MAG: riboflavin synthase [Phycisphaerae bacterium]|nr:riboflavin synthase [Phycisphaerae bacterium]
MFTGIIRHVGCVEGVESARCGRRVAISLGPLAAGLRVGDSVAVDGVCLTASAVREGVGVFDVIHETLSRTTLGGLTRQARVNLEPALRLGDGLDGHLVQGHVDGLARLSRVRDGASRELEFTAGADLTDLMVVKGSIAIHGVSLTLTAARRDGFGVAIIPTTLRETTLGQLRVGDEVNIETDVIGKYVLKCLKAGPLRDGGGLTMDKLRENGFL